MTSLEELRARYRQDRSRVEQIRRDLREQLFEGHSEDERIAVTVTVDGRLDGLEFDPRVFRSPIDSAGIAAAVKYAYDRAVEAALARQNELYQPILGPGFDATSLPTTAEDEAAQILQVGRELNEQARAEGYDD